MKHWIKLKDDVFVDDLRRLHPDAYILISFAKAYCNARNLPCKFTSLINDRDNANAKTKVHEDQKNGGRGIDLEIWDWPEIEQYRFIKKANQALLSIAATSIKTGEKRAAVHEGDHIHLQCAPRDSWADFL